MFVPAASFFLFFFFFKDTATTEIYTLSLHDALPICSHCRNLIFNSLSVTKKYLLPLDRKSTRLNSSHLGISYAVFCLKKEHKLNDPVLACSYLARRRPVFCCTNRY